MLRFFHIADVKIRYDQNSYIVTEPDSYAEVCVVSESPGIDERFTANVTINTTKSKCIIATSIYIYIKNCVSDCTDFVQLSPTSLEFSVNATDLYQTECFNLSIDSNTNDICGCFECSAIDFELHLLLDEASRVHVNGPNPTVTIEPPPQCSCSSEGQSSSTSSNSGIIVAAVVPSLFVVFAIVAIVVVIIVFYRKSSKLKRIDIEG